MPEINFTIDEDFFLPAYCHLLDSTADIDFIWGGRDSGKSYFVAEKLILDCLSKPYFRCILIKKTFESIKDAQWQTIKDIVEDWGIEHLFTFKQAPLEIHCKNGNKFIARGCDNAAKLKSISNPSDAWYEEGNQLEESDYIVATTTLRSNKGTVHEWFTFNPECEGDFKDFWLYKIFFKSHYERSEKNFIDAVQFDIPGTDTKFTRRVSSTHTTYRDNLKFCTPDRIAKHESMKAINAYYYDVYTKGLWGKRIAGGEVLKCFKSEKHVVKAKYNPDLALHLSFDENVVPYFPCGIFQIEIIGDKKNIRLIDSIAAYHPNNKVKWMCNEIIRKYGKHKAGMFIYGDATSQKDDVKQEEGHDLFKLIMDGLAQFYPSRRVNPANPSVVMSLNFFNTVLEINEGGIYFSANEDCGPAIRDYENTKEAPDGGIDKKTIRDKETGQTYQPWGHFVDLTRYFLCYAFITEYLYYQNGTPIRQGIYGINSSTKRADF